MMSDVKSYIATMANMPTNRLRLPTPEQKALCDWLLEFNRLVGVRWPGASLLDLAERPWWDWFQVDQDTPEQAVAEVERDQGDQLDREFPRRS
jgi:hypothetical protein